MPSTFQAETKSPSHTYATLLWAGLGVETRKGYRSATKSYEFFCGMHGEQAWPAKLHLLAPWVVNRAYGSTIAHQGQIKPDTIVAYLSALRSVRVDCQLDTSVFEDPHLNILIQGARNVFPSQKRFRLPITLDVLTQITPASTASQSIDDLNVDTALRVGFAGMLRMGEFTHTRERAANAAAFATANLSRSDVQFARDHATIRLKRSKADKHYQGVSIVLAATDLPNCPVRALRNLWTGDPQPSNAPLFRLDSGGFPRQQVLAVIHRRLHLAGIHTSGYSGHSLRKGAAQHAKNNGLPDEYVQKLGRWTSNAYRLYCETTQAELFRLSKAFQTGSPPSFLP